MNDQIFLWVGHQPNGKIVEQVQHFNYLGCEVTFNYEEDLRNKVHKFQNMCGTIKRTLKNKTQKETMLKFYKTMAVPILTYGSENWPMNRKDRRTIETAEMKFLRYVAGYSLTDHMRSDYIRDQLNVYNLNDKIRNSKQNWHDHILRMPNNRPAKQAMQYKPLGVRDIGRPRRRWEDDI